MSKSRNDHGKFGGKDHDDRDHGHRDKGKLLVGTNGDDTLAGSSRNDLIIGRAGDDRLLGGGGNDILVGDGGSGGKHWFWQHCFWWKPKGQFDDYLDGGSGSDLILAGKGNDVANYTLAENKKSHDVYDGGKGFDTLQLTLTHAEFQLASVQKDIAAFEAFLAKKANANSDNGKTFEFKSFNLDARNFEALEILLPNRAPTAQADAAATNEDTQLIVAGPGLLANDSDPDASDVISIIGNSPLSAMGAAIFTNPDGAYIYDPSNALALQQLGAGETATDTFTYTIADLAGVTATATVSIVVTGVNDGPIAAGDAYQATEDSTLAVAGPGVLANDSDVDGDALHAVLVSGPEHGTLGLNDDGSFSYLAHADYFGDDSFTYRASDGTAESATRTVAIMVTEVNDAPVTAPDAVSVAEDGDASGINVLGNDSAGPANEAGQALRVTGAFADHGSVAVNADGTLNYVAGPDFFGTDTIHYTASDNGSSNGVPDHRSAPGQVTVTVTEVNDAPLAFNDTATLAEDDANFVIDVLGNDFAGPANEAGQTLSVASATALHGLVLVNADGTLSYTPEADYFGNDTISYTMSDDGTTNGAADPLSASAQVAVTVTEVNDSPVTAPDAFSVAEDGSSSGINVFGNDSAGPANEAGQTLAVESASALHGSVLVNADGTLSYTPNADYFGSDTISYSASDNGTTNGAPDPRTALGQVNVTVTEVNDAPLAFNDSATLDEDSVDFVIDVLGNDFAGPANETGQALSVASATALHGSVLINADSTLSYTPDADYFGSDTISYTMSDDGTTNGAADPLSASAQVAVTVNDEPDAGDVELPGGTGGGAVRVAVIGGSTSTYVAAAAQLNDETSDAYDLDATAILVTTVSDWEALLADYDVVVLGGSGGGNDYGDTGLFAALGEFVTAGGGVVTTGWFQQAMAGMSVQTRADADAITPLAGAATAWAANLSTITINDADHPIAGGLTSYTTQALFHELATATDAAATVLATGTATSGSTLAAIAYDEGGDGRTAYLGSLHFASANYFPEFIRSGAADQIFEQAVAWAAGEPASGATTNQDSPYVVSAALLLPGTPDAEGDEIFIESVSPVSALGAEVYLDEDGNVVYNPSGHLRSLDEGEVATDSFTYTLADGPGAMGFASFAFAMSSASGDSTGTVTLTVEGVNDAPEAANDVRVTNEDSEITGNVFANDTDPEGHALTVTTTGTFITARGAEVTLNADGSYSYDPTGSAQLQALAQGTSVVDTFNYTISDGKLSDSATVSVTVAGLNEPGSGSVPSKILAQTPAGTELDYYVRFEINGVQGDWLTLSGFSLGADAPVSLGGGGGGGAGKVQMNEVHMTLGSSATVVGLTKAIAAGQVVDVEVEAYAPGSKGSPLLVDEYRFDQAFLSGLTTSGSPGATAEEVSFNFTKITHTHQTQDAKTGSLGDKATVIYDVQDHKTTLNSNGAPGEASKALPTDDLPVDVQLQYYMTYQGAPGWLELDGFQMNLENSTSIGSATGGAGAGKVSMGDVALTLGSSKQLVELMAKMTKGEHLDFLEVEAYATGGKGIPQLVDEYYFDTVFLTSLDTANNANVLGIDAGKFAHGHVEIDSKTGGVGPSSVQGWDFLDNKSWTHSSPDADFGSKSIPLQQVSADANLDYYVRFEINGVQGDWLTLSGFSLGADAPVSLGGGGGGGAGKVQMNEVHMTLGSSATVVGLTKAIAAGQVVDVEVEAYAPGSKGSPLLVDEYRFDQAFLSGLTTSGSPGATAEEVSFNFTKITHTHQTQDAKTGSLGDKATVIYDVQDHKTTLNSNGAPGEASKALPTDDLPVDVQLQYYMTYQGAPGWLELDGFQMNLENSTSIGSATGGAGAGKVSMGDVALTLGSSKQLVELMAKMTKGEHLDFLEVEAYATGGKGIPQLVDEYYFDTVFLTSLDTANNANVLGIDAGKFAHGHVEIDSKTGGVGPSSVQGWDFLDNKSWTHSSPDADFGSKSIPLQQVSADANLDYYVRFEINGVQGDWLTLSGFSLGADAPVSLGGGGGGGAGKVQMNEVHMTLGSSATVVGLTKAIAAGQVVDVEVEAYAPGSKGSPLLVDEYRFDQAFLSGLTTSGSPGATAEEVSFNFTKITHTHQTQDAKTGSLGDKATVIYDVQDHKTTLNSNGAPGEASKALPTDDLPVDVQLQYYMTYQGAPGWLELDGFQMNLENSTSIGSATGGAGAGKVSMGDVALTLGSSKQLVELMAKMTKGEHLDFLEVEAYATGGKGIPQLVDEYYFDTVFLTSLDTANNANVLGIDAGKFAHGHVEIDSKTGGVGPSSVQGWDFLDNKSWTHSSPDSDLF